MPKELDNFKKYREKMSKVFAEIEQALQDQRFSARFDLEDINETMVEALEASGIRANKSATSSGWFVSWDLNSGCLK